MVNSITVIPHTLCLACTCQVCYVTATKSVIDRYVYQRSQYVWQDEISTLLLWGVLF